MPVHYVYMMRQENGGPVKIGRSANVFLRWKNMNSDNPIGTDFIMAVEVNSLADAKTVEAEILKKLWRDNIRGEWFDGGCAGYAKLLLLEYGSPIKSLEFWKPGLYDNELRVMVNIGRRITDHG